MQKGIRVKTSSFTRHHVNVNMCRAKSVTTYTNSILAHQEVDNDNYDEALLLDVDGYVAEGAGENIFIVKKGKLYTPDLTSCLEGITRDSIFTLAKEMGIEIDRETHHPRRSILRRRSLLHRHGCRGDADPRTRPPHHRQRIARPDHRQAAAGIL